MQRLKYTYVIVNVEVEYNARMQYGRIKKEIANKKGSTYIVQVWHPRMIIIISFILKNNILLFYAIFSFIYVLN